MEVASAKGGLRIRRAGDPLGCKLQVGVPEEVALQPNFDAGPLGLRVSNSEAIRTCKDETGEM